MFGCGIDEAVQDQFVVHQKVHKEYRVPKEFTPYVESFIEEGRERNRLQSIDSLIIQFGKTEENAKTVGYCDLTVERKTNKVLEPPSITINEKYWNGSSDVQKELLMYHELGHCILNRYHDGNATIELGVVVPESIMYPYMFDAAIYENKRIDYLDELFGVKSVNLTDSAQLDDLTVIFRREQ